MLKKFISASTDRLFEIKSKTELVLVVVCVPYPMGRWPFFVGRKNCLFDSMYIVQCTTSEFKFLARFTVRLHKVRSLVYSKRFYDRETNSTAFCVIH